MDYVVEKMKSFEVIGVKIRVRYENAYETILQFWQDFDKKNMQGAKSGKLQETVVRCCIG